MSIKELKQMFVTELASVYNKDEAVALFNILIRHYLQIEPFMVALQPNFILNDNEKIQFLSALEELKKEKPIQYITGVTEFYSLLFKITPEVLIPRPETEELVDWIVNDYKNVDKKVPVTILDIGTGSGCIAVSLARNITNSKVVALDISEAAIKVATINALHNNVSIDFIQESILAPQKAHQTILQHTQIEKFSCIVSNPPYVRNSEKGEIKKNVLDFEPHLALFVNDEAPLLYYKNIACFAFDNLLANGTLYLEINQYLGEETIQLIQQTGFEDVILKKDFCGNNRMIKAVKKA